MRTPHKNGHGKLPEEASQVEILHPSGCCLQRRELGRETKLPPKVLVEDQQPAGSTMSFLTLFHYYFFFFPTIYMEKTDATAGKGKKAAEQIWKWTFVLQAQESPPSFTWEWPIQSSHLQPSFPPALVPAALQASRVQASPRKPQEQHEEPLVPLMEEQRCQLQGRRI